MKYVIQPLTGFNRNTGELLDDHAHILQSISDILTTPLGTRVMRREYGSLLPELLDKPMSDKLVMQMYAAIVIAVMKYEPRIRVLSLAVDYSSNGKMVFDIHYERLTPNSSDRHTFKFEVNKKR